MVVPRLSAVGTAFHAVTAALAGAGRSDFGQRDRVLLHLCGALWTIANSLNCLWQACLEAGVCSLSVEFHYVYNLV